ncbi:MAG: hypothetical protein KKA28_14755 [Planctomycetes bacterium]|nr:hypothetical protein [Planctomycetota bacterium]MCG2683826.1 hypothetical protein [Planctomycetales bacterium]
MCRSNHKSEIRNHKSTAFSLAVLVGLSAAAARATDFGDGGEIVRAISDSCIIAANQGGSRPVLQYYDGYTWTNHYSQLVNFHGCGVGRRDRKPGPDGYWLLPGESTSSTPWDYALNKWDGKTFTDLRSNLIGFSGRRADIAKWGGSGSGYWLISGAGNYQSTPKLNKFDGANWTDLSSGISDKGYGITDMLYNGSYWLIVGNGGWAKKYDGTTWTDVSSGWGSGWGWDIDGLGWNGSYWLLGGCKGRVKKFDGSNWTDLSSAAGFGGGDPYGIAWSPTLGYWLLGSNGALKRYDGATWTAVPGWSSYWNASSVEWTGTTFVIGYNDTSNGHGLFGLIGIASYDGTTLMQGVKVIPEPGSITLVVCAAVAGLIWLWVRKG